MTSTDVSTNFGEVSPGLPGTGSLSPRPQGSPRPNQTGLANWQAQKVKQFVDDHLGNPIRVADLAKLSKLSSSQFSKSFKVTFQISPYEYILRRRIDAAKFLMLNSTESLSQIACGCGMYDQAHFTKLFKRIVGTSPLRWRNAVTQIATVVH